MTDPIGIDTPLPRLGWQISDERRGANQAAFQIIVGTDSLRVLSGIGDFWDSGKQNTWQSRIIYGGKPLQPRTKYFWKVKLWDMDGMASQASTIASFETGLMKAGSWTGMWISDSRDENEKAAAYFRKTFVIDKPIRSARIYIAVAGLYELYVNGEKVGDHFLDPMFTRYDRRTLYITYDVTKMLKNGENVLGVLLGNGWYNLQSKAVWYFHKAAWRNRPKFCLDLRILSDDNPERTISTSTNWKTSLSPIIFNSIYTGEHIDNRLLQPGWDRPGFDDSEWGNAIPVSAPSQNIHAQVLHPIRHVAEIPVKSMNKISDRHYLFELVKNISGVSRIKVKGTKGATLRVVHAERLGANGRADLSNIDMHYRPVDDTDPFQTDIYVLHGDGEETFMPHFNYKGFQFVEVISDKPVDLTEESLTAFFMHSDVPPRGFINSSNPTLDRIWEATNNSYLSNLFGYPTDCPQREKNGWTGDAHIAVETGLFNFDGITIYEKWMADHFDEQQPNGVLPAIIPTSGWGYTWANGPDWTSTIALIPWNLYLFYGDSWALLQYYDNIKRYVDHITEESPKGLTSWGLGDWVPVNSVTPKEFTSSIYYFIDASILSKAAELMGRKDDANKYFNLAEKIKSAINRKYLNGKTGIYGSGLQTELSAALHWGIVPDSLKCKVAENLSERVISDGKHIDVGLLGSKTILNALSMNGYADLAYEVALQETYPSWGWWIENGATTLFENWQIYSESDISLNHIMFGEISAWFFKSPGGINPDPEQPGFRNILLKPDFVSGLEHFEASHNGPFGTISSSWRREGDKIMYNVVVPPNSTATLILKGANITENGIQLWKSNGVSNVEHSDTSTRMNLVSGNYLFSIDP